MNRVSKYINRNVYPILLIIGGIIDQTTDLLAQLLVEVNAPTWCATALRILIISFGAFKLYYSVPKDKE
jgi:hypothetical protein